MATVVPFFKHLPRCVGILPVLALIPLDDFAFAIYNDDIHRIFSVSTIRFQHLGTILASCCFGIQVKGLCMVLFRNIPVQIRVLAGHTSLGVNSVVKLLVSCIQRLIQPSQIDRGFLRRHCRNRFLGLRGKPALPAAAIGNSFLQGLVHRFVPVQSGNDLVRHLMDLFRRFLRQIFLQLSTQPLLHRLFRVAGIALHKIRVDRLDLFPVLRCDLR